MPICPAQQVVVSDVRVRTSECSAVECCGSKHIEGKNLDPLPGCPGHPRHSMWTSIFAYIGMVSGANVVISTYHKWSVWVMGG